MFSWGPHYSSFITTIISQKTVLPATEDTQNSMSSHCANQTSVLHVCFSGAWPTWDYSTKHGHAGTWSFHASSLTLFNDFCAVFWESAVVEFIHFFSLYFYDQNTGMGMGKSQCISVMVWSWDVVSLRFKFGSFQWFLCGVWVSAVDEFIRFFSLCLSSPSCIHVLLCHIVCVDQLSFWLVLNNIGLYESVAMGFEFSGLDYVLLVSHSVNQWLFYHESSWKWKWLQEVVHGYHCFSLRLTGVYHYFLWFRYIELFCCTVLLFVWTWTVIQSSDSDKSRSMRLVNLSDAVCSTFSKTSKAMQTVKSSHWVKHNRHSVCSTEASMT